MPRISNTEIIHQLSQPVISIRSTVTEADLHNFIAGSFEKMSGYLREIRESISNVPLAIYHNYQNMDNEIDVEAVFQVTKLLPEKDGIKSYMLPENRLVHSMFLGSENDMDNLYAELEKWINLNGFKIIGPTYEYYYNNEDFGIENLLIKFAIPVTHKRWDK